MNDVLTSSEAAQWCGVSFRTVIRWIEKGELQAYRLPGRGDYRVPAVELRRFMREHGIPEAAPSSASVPKQTASNRILVVDDELPMANAIMRTLRTDGFETIHASNGFAAGTLLQSQQPILMTLDIRMPGMDGLEVLRFLKTQPQLYGGKILVVSGDEEARLTQALALGAHGLLRKPFDHEQLLKVVRRQLGRT